MNEEAMCEICGIHKATDKCVSCGKKICGDCSLPQLGVCKECSKPKEGGLVSMLISCGAVQYGTFTLASGKESSYYVDMKKAITDVQILRKIADMMAPYVGPNDKIAGVELGAVPIIVALALKTDRPFIVIRKDPKEHGTKKQYEGEIVGTENIIFVEDVTTTAGSLVRAIGIVRDEGAIVEKALVVVDREEGAADNLGQVGVELIPLVRASDIVQ